MRHKLIASFVLVVVAGCSSPVKRSTPSASPTASATMSPSRSPSAGSGARAVKIAYVRNGNELRVYDVATNSSVKTAARTSTGPVSLPRFETPALVTFVTTRTDAPRTVDAFWELAATGGTARKLFDSPVRIVAYEWSPSRTAVAFVTWSSQQEFALRVWRRSSGVALVRTFGANLGRGGTDRDEITVHWSPDGERVLVVMTPLDATTSGPKPLMYVIRQGKDVIPSRDGTQALWSAASTVVYSLWESPGSWRAIDVTSGSERPIGLEDGGSRPLLSPDGSAIVYDTAHDRRIHVFKLASAVDHVIGSGAVSPVWLDAETVAVTDADACASDCEGSWKPSGTVSALSISGARRRLALPSTFDLGVLYA